MLRGGPSTVWLALWVWASAVHGQEAVEHLRVPEGFSVTLVADDDLAHNAYALTVDARGRPVVSGPGYIRTLIDDSGDGRADRAVLFSSSPASGAQGLYFDGPHLICTGDGALRFLADHDGDGRADDEGVVWAALRGGEHGAHAVRLGPDGWFYVVCGNDTGVAAAHVTRDGSPVARPSSGTLLRVARDGSSADVVAHGFRNPYDADFHPLGHLLTIDSDGERVHHLPWYAPTRLFDVAQGMAHGWLEAGWVRSWSRPAAYFDNVERLVEMGRGSPTGAEVYRHRQFPARYRDGLFAACWTLGRIYFIRLEPEGASFRATAEVFLESQGDTGFAPVDLAVDPAGHLLVAMGGRGTRGGVFRVRYEGPAEADSATADANHARFDRTSPGDTLTVAAARDAVLAADQPLASWSRAHWVPLAERLGPAPFVTAIEETRRPAAERIRAVEVLTELWHGVPLALAANMPAETEAAVLARIAWSLGRSRSAPTRDAQRLLCRWTAHGDPQVERAAWEALATLPAIDPQQVPPPAWEAIGSADRRVRAAAVLVARGPGAESYSRHVAGDAGIGTVITHKAGTGETGTDNAGIVDSGNGKVVAGKAGSKLADGSLAARLGRLWIDGPPSCWTDEVGQRYLATCLAAFDELTDDKVAAAAGAAAGADAGADACGWGIAQLRYDAIRLLQIALGDVHGRPPAPDAPTGYVPGIEPVEPAIRQRLIARLAAWFPTGEAELDRELARLLALLSADDASLAARIALRCTAESDPVDDVHYLLVLSRLTAPRGPAVNEQIAAAVARLHHKLAARGMYPSRTWPQAVGDALAALVAQDAALAMALADDPHFNRPDQAPLAARLPPTARRRAAERWFALAVQSEQHDEPWTWTTELIELWAPAVEDEGTLPPESVEAQVAPLVAQRAGATVARTTLSRESLQSALRDHWDDPAVRDAISQVLARWPAQVDRPRLVASLHSVQPQVVLRAATALAQLSAPGDVDELAAAVAALGRCLPEVDGPASSAPGPNGTRDDPRAAPREALVALLAHWAPAAGLTFADEALLTTDPRAVHRVWRDWFAEQYPEAAAADASSALDSTAWQHRLARLPWSDGDPDRGRQVFEKQSCHRCHLGTSRLGPDLAGAAARLGREALLIAIVDPNRDVAPTYHTTLVETHAGRVYHGLVVYESPEALLLQTAVDHVVRLTGDEIAAVGPSTQSLMPTGLLDGLSDGELVDLFTFLESLGRP